MAFGALLMINVDDFKLYNQLYGDEEGDEALKRIAKIIQEEVTGECVIAVSAEKNLRYFCLNEP